VGRSVTIRHHVRVRRPAAAVWDLVGDPARLHEWFPGLSGCTVDGTTRIITTRAGLPLPEEILENDPLQRRLRYRITAPLFAFHQGTVDVIDLEDGTCLAVYTTVCDPPTMALVIGGGTREALDELKRQMEEGQG
jgi:uncharacterized protein YndB with AHSA1/START domain